jgi:hypothetical protein
MSYVILYNGLIIQFHNISDAQRIYPDLLITYPIAFPNYSFTIAFTSGKWQADSNYTPPYQFCLIDKNLNNFKLKSFVSISHVGWWYTFFAIGI